MTRAEILQVAKPILYNTEMVRAIQDGRKTTTRRVIKAPCDLRKYKFYELHDNYDGRITTGKDKLCAGFYTDQQIFYIDGEKHIDAHYYSAPYKPGQYLYVRETFAHISCANCDGDIDIGVCSKRENGGEPIGCYMYRADGNGRKWDDGKSHWHPSIHMPKEAARIFLKVTDVRVERLRDITFDGIEKEGISHRSFETEDGVSVKEFLESFISLWDCTIKKQDLDKYGWEVNPWVWVIGFERVEVDG